MGLWKGKRARGSEGEILWMGCVCVCKEGGEGKSAGGTEKGCSARLGEPHTPLQPACPCRSCPWVRAGRALVLDFDRLMPSPSWSRSERMRTRLTTKVPPVQHPSRCSLGVSCSIAQASAQSPRRSRKRRRAAHEQAARPWVLGRARTVGCLSGIKECKGCASVAISVPCSGFCEEMVTRSQNLATYCKLPTREIRCVRE